MLRRQVFDHLLCISHKAVDFGGGFDRSESGFTKTILDFVIGFVVIVGLGLVVVLNFA